MSDLTRTVGLMTQAAGCWMRSAHGWQSTARASTAAAAADEPKPDWGWYTKKDDRIYAHILENPIGPLALTGLDAKRVGAVRRLADGSEVLRGESWITNAYENLAFVTLGTIPHFTYLLPDPADTVLEIGIQGGLPMKPITAIVLGAGQRGANVYAAYALSFPNELKIVGVAEPRADRRAAFAREHGIPEGRCFAGWEDALRQDKFADCVFVCTQDRMHFEPVMQALEKGYDVLCEKADEL